MSICPKKGIARRECLYRDPYVGCDGCLVGTNVKTLYVCMGCGAAFFEFSDYEKELRCPECGDIVDCCLLDDFEGDIWTVLKEHYERCASELKKRWKQPSRKPLGLYVKPDGTTYAKLSFGRLDGWKDVDVADEFEVSESELKEMLDAEIEYLKQLEDEE